MINLELASERQRQKERDRKTDSEREREREREREAIFKNSYLDNHYLSGGTDSGGIP